MIDRRIAGPVLAADAKRHGLLDLVGQLRKPIDKVRRAVQGQVGTDGGIAASDVETDADHRNLFVVGGHPADRHDVADVAVGHERGALRTAGDVLELRQRASVVLAEDGNPIRHQTIVGRTRGPQRRRNLDVKTCAGGT